MTDHATMEGPWIDPAPAKWPVWAHRHDAPAGVAHIFTVTEAGEARQHCMGEDARVIQNAKLIPAVLGESTPCPRCDRLNLRARVRNLEGQIDAMAPAAAAWKAHEEKWLNDIRQPQDKLPVSVWEIKRYANLHPGGEHSEYVAWALERIELHERTLADPDVKTECPNFDYALWQSQRRRSERAA